MCLINWNERSFRWFRDASEYTGYNRELAKLLLERIPSRGTLCDLGCGMGLIDLELSPHFDEITCVDISAAAIAELERAASERGLSNLRAAVGDTSRLDGRWETVMSLYHGELDLFPKFISMAEKCFITIVHDTTSEDAEREARRKKKYLCSVPEIRGRLDNAGIAYTCENRTIEYGQPFETLDDAAEFVAVYDKNPAGVSVGEFIEENLVKTGGGRFPYYLPNKKSYVLFVIDKK